MKSRMLPGNSNRIVLVLLFCVVFVLTCKNDTVTPGPPQFDPLVPTIDSFAAKRGTTLISDKIVYSGEDINLEVEATSQSWPESCGLTEGDVVSGNLFFSYKSFPPDNIPAPGLFSATSPGENEAVWRVPNLDQYDSGEGLIYTIQVNVFDECLEKSNTGTLVLRAFANQGPPAVTNMIVKSSVNAATPVTEEIDKNGYYEVELADECSISLTAVGRTMPDICANRGVEDGQELTYQWSSSLGIINLTYDQDPTLANATEFDIPVTIGVSDKFQVECLVTDQCTGEFTIVVFDFVVVGAPEINSLTPSANGLNLGYDPFFDNYPVLRGDDIIINATALVKDRSLCDMKGIKTVLEWAWSETSGSVPKLDPDFDPHPDPDDNNSIDFTIPAAENGTVYSFNCEITDRCNGLADSENVNLLVVIPPTAQIGIVERNGSETLVPSPDSGRYEAQPGDQISVRIFGTAASDTSFCSERGISDSPPVEYHWVNPWGDFVILNYEVRPEAGFSDLTCVIPDGISQMDIDLECSVDDICNELYTEVKVPFRIVGDSD